MGVRAKHENHSEPDPVSLDSVIIIGELDRRPSRPPNYEAENRALISLSETLTTTPEAILHRLVEIAMNLCMAHSAGVSLLERDERGQEVFRWNAIAGQFATNVGGTIERAFSPCGDVIRRKRVLLFRHPERHYLFKADPPIVESLLAPFDFQGKPIGTIWVIAHDETRKFDAEDARLIGDLGKVASATYQILHSLEVLKEEMEERKQAQKLLQASRERFRALVKASSEALYRMSPDWTEMRGLRSTNFLANTDAPSRTWLQSYIPLEDQALVTATIDGAIRNKTKFELEHRVLREDGSVGWTFSRAIPVLDLHGEIIEWFGAATDVTVRREAQEALVRSEKLAATGRLAATISHEINNPLEATINLLYLASRDPGLSPETKDYLQMADQELRRATHITRQTLGFFRDGNRREPVALPTLIDEVLKVYASKLRHRNIAVVCKYNHGECRDGNDCFIVNAGELRQMISNLLANGIDALNDNGTLHIRASRTTSGQQHIHLTIADNGCGIRAGNLKRIFEPFFTTKEAVGTGLGLWVTQELVRKHNGSIRVRSREGTGTVFRISLPVAA